MPATSAITTMLPTRAPISCSSSPPMAPRWPDRRERSPRLRRAVRSPGSRIPKAGKLGTDLNRDRVRERVAEHGLATVRQVALDDVWSALRLKSA
jgi:hypothetical protein